MQNWDRQCLIAQSCKGGRIIFGPIGEESTKLPLRQQHPAVLFEYSDLAVENLYAPLHGFGQVNHDLGHDLVVGAYKPLINRTFRLAENVKANRCMEANTQIGKIVIRFKDKEARPMARLNARCRSIHKE